ncbi:hypothetical protein [Nocardia sp. NPDC046763]|uniref:hypothetical protein n=1 Tax=Nocardia sp. NPDC046763 TaxID=3155256 RepID=UPI0033D0D31F
MTQHGLVPQSAIRCRQRGDVVWRRVVDAAPSVEVRLAANGFREHLARLAAVAIDVVDVPPVPVTVTLAGAAVPDRDVMVGMALASLL